MTNLSAKIKDIQSVTAGSYVKFEGRYYTNAFPGVYTERDGKAWLERADDFQIMIEKQDGFWVVYSEEHEPDEIGRLEGVDNKFKTLAAAKELAEEFGRGFAQLYSENN
jgi:hypothetical protein